MEGSKRSTGTVKWFSAKKGFGFIAPDDRAEDLFVHQTWIQSNGFRTLSECQPVEFSVDFSEDGRTKAVDVIGVSRSQRAPLSGRGGGRGRGGYVSGRRDGGYVKGGRSGGRGYGDNRDGACYNCGRFGHLARSCHQSGGNGGGNRRFGGGGGACYNCGDEGHFARDCANGEQN